MRSRPRKSASIRRANTRQRKSPRIDTEKGSQTYRCSSCGEITKVVELAPYSGIWSHDYQTVTVQPTCTEDGYTVRKCSRCGKETGQHTSIVKAPGHQFVETVVAPTCTESGYTVQKCSVCHEETGERTNLVAPLGHEYKNGVCTRCGAPELRKTALRPPVHRDQASETYETSVVVGGTSLRYPLRSRSQRCAGRPAGHQGTGCRCGGVPHPEPGVQPCHRRDAGHGYRRYPLCAWPTTAARPSSPSTAQL